MLAIEDTSEVVLDIQNLIIEKVGIYMSATFYELNYEIQNDDLMGCAALRIYLKDKLFAGETASLSIKYRTTVAGRAISWLNANQTASKTLPYMFTECQPINCRSVAPL